MTPPAPDDDPALIDACIVEGATALFKDAGDDTPAVELPWLSLTFVRADGRGERRHRLSLERTRSLLSALIALRSVASAHAPRGAVSSSQCAVTDTPAPAAPFMVESASGQAQQVRLTFPDDDDLVTYTLDPGHVDDLVGALEAAIAMWSAAPPVLLADVRIGSVKALCSDGVPRPLYVDVEASPTPGDERRVMLFVARDQAGSDTWLLTASEVATLASLLGRGGALGGAEPWLRVTAEEGSITLTFDDEMIRERLGDAFSLYLHEDGERLRDLLASALAVVQSTPVLPNSTTPERVADLAWNSGKSGT